MHDDFLATILIERRLLDRELVAQAQEAAAQAETSLDDILIRDGTFTREHLLKILENYFFCTSADPRAVAYDAKLLALIPHRLAQRHLALCLGEDENALRVAFAQPDNLKALDAIAQMARRPVTAFVALPHELKKAIEEQYKRLDTEIGPLTVKEKARPASASDKRRQGDFREKTRTSLQLRIEGNDSVELFKMIMEVAIKRDVSDVHFQPAAESLMVRYRLDGILYTIANLSKQAERSLISRIKVLSGMDIAEHRLPQDGRQTINTGEMVVDCRVNCLPSQFGEKIVIRLLRKDMSLLELENLQMPPPVRQAYNECLEVPQGMFLVTGPTGSGKTTTLYATLNAIDRESLNVSTLENPIEYSIPHLTQVQINEEIGLTFESGLRAFLRQDPDVVLIGEIRDLPTVEIACRAALTGHRVFSTLHTNDACQAITRLLDMGTEPFLIAATLRGVLAQRLIRVNCRACLEEHPISEPEREFLGYPRVTHLHRGKGCQACSGTGYKGRKAIYEYFRVTEMFHRMILDRTSPYALRQAAQRSGMITLGEFARREVLAGNTTVSEVQRSVLSDEKREQTCSNCQRTVSADFTVCPFCKHVLKEICSGCGHPVDPSWEACPNCGREIEREWKRLYCDHCLAPVEPEWTHCLFCGEELH